MLPLIPFALGLVTGAAAIRLLKSDSAKSGLDKTKAGLGKVQEQLREAAVSSLTAIETSSARARNRLSAKTEAPAAEKASAAEAATKPAPKPRRKAAAAAPRKRTPKAAAQGKEQAS